MSSSKTSKKTPKPAVDTVPVDGPATSGGGSSLLASSSSASSAASHSPSVVAVDAAKAASHSSFAPLVPVGISLEDILAALRTATPEQLSELREAIGVSTTKKASAAAAAPKPKKEKSIPAPLPVPDDGSVPTAASYRMNPSDIDHSVCVGRILREDDKDKRWKPAVYREHQCCKAVNTGSDLCSGCNSRQEKAAETGKHGAWNGRITEDPPSWCHMLGTAVSAKCKWNPDGDSASIASSHSSTTEQMDAKKEAAAAAKAEKAAAAAAKKEEAAKKKAAAAAAKAEKAEKPKKEKKSNAAETSSSNAASAPAVADTSAPIATVAGKVEIIGHTMYWVRNGNAYDYDEETKKVGAFMGRKTPAGDIDEDAEEVTEEESDSE